MSYVLSNKEEERKQWIRRPHGQGSRDQEQEKAAGESTTDVMGGRGGAGLGRASFG